MQLACRHKSITAIVAFAADSANRLEIEMLLREFGHGGACIFHQGERWNAIFLSGGAINGAHLFRGNDFHTLKKIVDERRLVQSAKGRVTYSLAAPGCGCVRNRNK